MRGIAKLAKELGISTGTVSRALNGKPDVNKETRARVLEEAARMGYSPNQAARALAQGQTGLIGFMIDLNPETAASSDYFFMGVFDGVQSVLSKEGLDLTVLPCATDQDRLTYLKRFVERGSVDGMVLAGTRRIDPCISFLEGSRLPFVTLGRSESGKTYSWIDLDFEGAVRQAVDRLVAMGHRRIAVTLPYGDINFGSIFLQAYRDSLAAHGIGYDPDMTYVTNRHEAAGYDIVDKMLALNDPPTAVVLIYEVTAIGLYRRLQELKLVPGRDLAVVGFRDEPTIRFLSPSVTCFHLSLHDLGVSIGKAIIARLQAGRRSETLPPHRFAVPMEIRPGESDALPPPQRLAQRVSAPATR